MDISVCGSNTARHTNISGSALISLFLETSMESSSLAVSSSNNNETLVWKGDGRSAPVRTCLVFVNTQMGNENRISSASMRVASLIGGLKLFSKEF